MLTYSCGERDHWPPGDVGGVTTGLRPLISLECSHWTQPTKPALYPTDKTNSVHPTELPPCPPTPAPLPLPLSYRPLL